MKNIVTGVCALPNTHVNQGPGNKGIQDWGWKKKKKKDPQNDDEEKS